LISGGSALAANRTFYVYILASRRNGTLYIGTTNDLQRRIYEHKHDVNNGFTKWYGVHSLVYYEMFDDVYDAIYREKQLKWWRRKWKLDLIERHNPDWIDLARPDGEIIPLPMER
jgi:putative endonuclease